MNLTPHEAAPFAVTLSAPAPAGGVTVTLKSSDASKVIVTPASVVVPQGATTPAIQPQVTGVGIGAATISATATGYISGAGPVTVTAPTMAFTGLPQVIVIGGSGKLTLTLTGGQAPAGGLTVNLNSSDTSKATVPATVSFAPGTTTVTVPVTGVASGAATITASATGIASAIASVTVIAQPTVTASYAANFLQVIDVVLTNTSGVTAVNLRITSITNLTAVAPNVIALRPNVIIPMPYGNLAGGQALARNFTFIATAGSIEVPFSFVVTYEADNLPPQTAVIDVPFPRSMSFSGSPLAINAGAPGKLTLNLLGNQAPAAGLIVSLRSSDPSRATVPATVSFLPGATSVTVPVTGIAPGSVTITATATVVNFPATATATVNVTGTIRSPANTAVRLGQSAPFAVTLSAPAPAGGVTVTLKSSDASKVIVTPASVVIPQGATTPTTLPQVTGAGIGAATISAAATGYISGTGTVTVAAPTMAFTGLPPVIVIGGSGKLTLSLTGGQAPAGGLTLNLNSSDTSKATVPATVSFAPGTTTVTVPVTGVAPGTATITASATGIASATASVTVTPPPTVTASYGANFLQLINVVLTNTSVVTAINLRITSVANVTTVAPGVIALLSGNVIPMPYGNLAGGQAAVRSLSFGATAGNISVPFSFRVSYEADNMPPQTAVIDVPFPRSMSFSGGPLAINAGASGKLTLNLLGNQAPADGLSVNLRSSDPSRATVPATVSFPPGATSVSVPVTGTAPVSAVITAIAFVVGFPAIATAEVNVTGTITSPANTPLKLGQSAPFAVTLSAPAPAGGVTVTLKSSDASKVIVTPASVVVPQGATTPAIQPQVTGAGIGAVTISAAATGYISGTGTVTVAAPTMAFTGLPPVIVVSVSGKLTLTLTGGQAPVGGLTVNLNSSDTSKATVPATVSFAPGATTVTVPVTGVAPGTATITASATGIASATANVTVTPRPTVTASYGANSLQVINVGLVNTSEVTAVNLRITSVTNVTAVAPNVIGLRPVNVVIPMPYGTLVGGQGATRSFTFEATAGSISVPFSFTITYEADNMPPQTAVIDVPFPRSMSFSGGPLAIDAGASGKLTLNLLGNQAPAAGLIVSLSSSDPSKATVPATVSFPPGATSVSVPVAGLAPGSVTITANATVVNFPATATATVNVTGTITSPANTPVRLGESAPFVVTLSAPAPAGGVTVTLKSSDTSKVIVTPASVVIPQGATTPTTLPQVTGAGIGAATISAAATGYISGTGTATVAAPTMVFTGPPSSITIGGAGILTLTLAAGQAPANGLTVNLNSSDTSKATVPATVSFAPGTTTVTVPVTGVAPGTATITASATGIASATASVTVTPPPTVTAAYGANFLQLINVVLTNTSGVMAVNLRITSVTRITAVAPNVIALRPNVIIPMPYGNVAGGQAVVRSFSFEATAGSIEVPFNFMITYEADNMSPQTAVIDVPFPRSMSFSGGPLAVNAGASGNLTLNLLGNQAPGGGLIVNLSSSDPSRVTVPATVSFAPGATSVTVPVTGIAPGPAVITATATVVNFPAIATAAVNVTGTISSRNMQVSLGSLAPLSVTLSAPAPAGGVTVTLKSSDTSKVIVTSASVVIPQGQTTATQAVIGVGIGAATITAAAPGYTSVPGTVTVPAPDMAFTGSPLVIVIGGSGKLTLSLSGGQAPVGGLTVNLNSSDTSKATVPATVSFAAGFISVTVPVTGVAPGTATITANVTGIASATASVTVRPPPTVIASYAVNFLAVIDVHFLNTSGETAVNLRLLSVTNVTGPAPNVIALRPGAVFPQLLIGALAGGQGLAWGFLFQATLGSISVPFSFTITYEADNMPVRTAVIDVPFPRAMNLSGSPLAINVGASGNLTLNLTGHRAPAGGMTVELTSNDPSRATVPATVIVPAGETSVTVPVRGIAPGTVTITASATVRSFPAIATAIVNVGGGR